MLCQNCGENEANVKYTQIVNGEKKEMILCEDCARKMGIGNFKMNIPINFSNFLGDFFDDYKSEQLLPSFVKEKNNECNNCGELYKEFIKTGLLGCEECYDVFQNRLDPILKNLQGSVKHVGRRPLNIEEKIENKEVNKDVKVESNKEEKQTKENKKENELMKLQKDLNKAIEEERYEDAAVIRDEIKKLEKNEK
jgi:protein arginine kinase activator